MGASYDGQGLRVTDRDLGPEVGQAGGDVQGGGVAHVVAQGLEGRPQDGDGPAGQVAAHVGAGQLDDPVALLAVDGVDPAQQVRQVHGAVKVGTGLQRPDVLGKAASAEADAGLEEAPADARVVADGVGQDGDVGPGGVAQVRHGVDEADLGGQEGVRRGLDQLCGGVVGDDPGDALLQQVPVDGVERGLGLLGVGGVGGDPVDDAVGVEGVGHGEALAQELGVPQHQGASGQALGHLLGGAHRDGGLAHHQAAPALGQGIVKHVDHAPQLAQVGLPSGGGLRGPHGDEVDVGLGQLGRCRR